MMEPETQYIENEYYIVRISNDQVIFTHRVYS